jgi:hypothetical protein
MRPVSEANPRSHGPANPAGFLKYSATCALLLASTLGDCPSKWGATGNIVTSIRPPAEVPLSIVNSTKDTMLLDAKRLEGYALRATDGEIGKVKDLYFDDRQWKIRYAVANTGNWLPGRKVLVAPNWISYVDWKERKITVKLDQKTIEEAPSKGVEY